MGAGLDPGLVSMYTGKLTSPGFDIRPFQPEASHYTYQAIIVPFVFITFDKYESL
jgi:hypothetical protein